MKTFMVLENRPYEYINNECHDIGFQLVDYLPQEWEPIKKGEQEHGIDFKIETNEEGLSGEEIIRRNLEMLRNMRSVKVISFREIAFKTLLCEFLTLCNQNIRLYTESNFVRVMGINGFNIPKFSYRAFDLYKKEEVTTICIWPKNLYNVEDTIDDIHSSPIQFARVYSYEKDEQYYIAVLLEMIRQRKFLKQCEHCKRWFVVSNKRDEKYCKRISPYDKSKTCYEVMKRIRDAKRIKDDPLKCAKEKARNRANSREIYHPGAATEFKEIQQEWQNLYEHGKISKEEYIDRLNKCMRSGGRMKTK